MPSLYTLSAVLVSLLQISFVRSTSLPIVDLGYQRHQAISYDTTWGFYNFSNIRYAAPPTGNLRFRAPTAPAINRTAVDTGSVNRICPQSFPYWAIEGIEFLVNYTQGLAFNATGMTIPNLPAQPQDPRATEDCLFLDVIVPKAVFDGGDATSGGAPVVVWIHGGGYTQGHKQASGDPAGLISRSKSFSANGIIYVSINYRLGAFGWSSGATLTADGVANAGLLDQRFALEWVQMYIALFGGNPDNVTVMGESAGGASIMSQITAYGGSKGPVPFNRAIAQSPALWPTPSSTVEENTFQAFLQLLNVSTLAQARALSSDALITANSLQVGDQSAYGTFTYGPVVDGTFAPGLPAILLSQGKFDSTVSVMVGHNADEGPLFTNPAVSDTPSYIAYLQGMFPTMPTATLNQISNSIYPALFDGSQPYTSQLGRAILTASESLIACNTFFLDTAFKNKTFSYVFDVPPPIHAQDIAYTYYVGDGSDASTVLPAVAQPMQDFLVSFAVNGTPRSVVSGVPTFPAYGKTAAILDLSATGIVQKTDPAANSRCVFWQTAAFQ
ncbi:carboxylesterase family protein-like protein [Lepidopterella palustris CBS 459.81]|uniref:Carboxylic ester hydrolase n=1 Tax=Lepidopterella palustris CBS 459.81 TaxID=1314670 RepID=A0A8E2E0I3_9PEZI|nr:carboxylesterase family protein-like protein [Lepidopterella palustris CBS 459.81]